MENHATRCLFAFVLLHVSLLFGPYLWAPASYPPSALKPASADASAPAPPPRFRDCLAAMTGKVLLEYRVRARARANKRVLMRVPGAGPPRLAGVLAGWLPSL